jgi:hypothetical protein
LLVDSFNEPVPSVSCITTGDDNAGADHDNPGAPVGGLAGTPVRGGAAVAVGELCRVGLALGVALAVVFGCVFDGVEGAARAVGFADLAGFSCFFQ